MRGGGRPTGHVTGMKHIELRSGSGGRLDRPTVDLDGGPWQLRIDAGYVDISHQAVNGVLQGEGFHDQPDFLDQAGCARLRRVSPPGRRAGSRAAALRLKAGPDRPRWIFRSSWSFLSAEIRARG